ncbi:hypothetical protein LCGC14_0225090 [marine sediment metagenome]|uniref:Uncharacterized protein n=1 Tax=marine sediment metagenome TaxID=412755 RepID=A0A0F9UCM1_9ZZZZ
MKKNVNRFICWLFLMIMMFIIILIISGWLNISMDILYLWIMLCLLTVIWTYIIMKPWWEYKDEENN